MTIVTYQGVVEKGNRNILLDESVQLPENAKVYAIVTEEKALSITLDRKKPIQILSPHLLKEVEVMSDNRE